MAFKEFAFSVNDFEEPKDYKNAEAVATLLVRLLLLEPGTIQSHPDMGVGLFSKYAHTTDKATELRSDFQRQINKYLPQFGGIRIAVQQVKKAYIIGAEIQDTVYSVYYDSDTSNITTKYTKLSEL